MDKQGKPANPLPAVLISCGVVALGLSMVVGGSLYLLNAFSNPNSKTRGSPAEGLPRLVNDAATELLDQIQDDLPKDKLVAALKDLDELQALTRVPRVLSIYLSYSSPSDPAEIIWQRRSPVPVKGLKTEGRARQQGSNPRLEILPKSFEDASGQRQPATLVKATIKHKGSQGQTTLILTVYARGAP